MNFNEYKDSIKVISAIILLTILNYFLPMFSLFVLLVWPIPIVYLIQKENANRVIVVTIIAAFLNGFLFGPVMGLITVIGFGLVGFVLGNAVKEELKPRTTLIVTAMTVFLSQALMLIVSKYLFGFDLNTIVKETSQIIGGGDSQMVEDLLGAPLSIITMIFPGLIAISSIITGIFNYYIAIWYLRRKGMNIFVYKKLRYWYFPRWPIAIGLITGLLLKRNIVFLNLNILLFFLVFLQGFAVAVFYLLKKTDSTLWKIAFLFIVFFFPPVPIILMVLGLVDMWFNLRKVEKQPG